MAAASDPVPDVDQRVLVSMNNGVKRITLNAPQRMNAVDRAMAERFRDLVVESAGDESKVIILTGAGGNFCSGANIKEMQRPDGGGFRDVRKFLRNVTNPTIEAIRGMSKPVIAAVPGVATGVGCNYAFAADIRIAATNARFGQVFSRIGLVPDGGSTYLLPRMIGYPRAYELMVTGEIFGAEKARSLGLVNQVVAPEELEKTVDEWAACLASGPLLAFAGIKRALHYGETHSLSEALEYEGVEQEKCVGSEDAREAMATFLEKREAKFQGR